MFKSIALLVSSCVSAQQVIDLRNPQGLQTLMQLNSMIDPNALQNTIMNLKQ